MKNPQVISWLAVLSLVVLALPSVQAAKPAQGSKAAVDNKAQASLREVEYSSLEGKIGSELVIDTVNNTTRRGTLVRYTNVSIVVKLGPESGSIELGMPRKSIRRIMLEIPPADPLFLNEKSPHEGKPGAKKN